MARNAPSNSSAFRILSCIVRLKNRRRTVYAQASIGANSADGERTAGPPSNRSPAEQAARQVRRIKELLDLGASVGIDFQADGDFDDTRCRPLHDVSS